VVCVILDEPTNGIYGGAIAAPTFSKLGRFTVAHLKIPPSSTYRVDPPKTARKAPAKAGVGQVSDQGARD
jgi:cell division protein FtsI (penicillin-binding protein 3)